MVPGTVVHGVMSDSDNSLFIKFIFLLVFSKSFQLLLLNLLDCPSGFVLSSYL